MTTLYVKRRVRASLLRRGMDKLAAALEGTRAPRRRGMAMLFSRRRVAASDAEPLPLAEPVDPAEPLEVTGVATVLTDEDERMLRELGLLELPQDFRVVEA